MSPPVSPPPSATSPAAASAVDSPGEFSQVRILYCLIHVHTPRTFCKNYAMKFDELR
jgi:hypothetical protein